MIRTTYNNVVIQYSLGNWEYFYVYMWYFEVEVWYRVMLASDSSINVLAGQIIFHINFKPWLVLGFPNICVCVCVFICVLYVYTYIYIMSLYIFSVLYVCLYLLSLFIDNHIILFRTCLKSNHLKMLYLYTFSTTLFLCFGTKALIDDSGVHSESKP